MVTSWSASSKWLSVPIDTGATFSVPSCTRGGAVMSSPWHWATRYDTTTSRNWERTFFLRVIFLPEKSQNISRCDRKKGLKKRRIVQHFRVCLRRTNFCAKKGVDTSQLDPMTLSLSLYRHESRVLACSFPVTITPLRKTCRLFCELEEGKLFYILSPLFSRKHKNFFLYEIFIQRINFSQFKDVYSTDMKWKIGHVAMFCPANLKDMRRSKSFEWRSQMKNCRPAHFLPMHFSIHERAHLFGRKKTIIEFLSFRRFIGRDRYLLPLAPFLPSIWECG